MLPEDSELHQQLSTLTNFNFCVLLNTTVFLCVRGDKRRVVAIGGGGGGGDMVMVCGVVVGAWVAGGVGWGCKDLDAVPFALGDESWVVVGGGRWEVW